MFRRALLSTLLCFASSFHAVAQASAMPNDNDKVIALSAKGLDDDIVIARIKSSSWKFQVDDDSLVALKKAGVSSKVVAAMLDASVITTAQVSVDGKPLLMQTLGQGKTGGRLGSALTYGIKSVKEKAFINGPHAKTYSTSKQPTITIALPKGETIESYILVLMDKKDDRRELEGSFYRGNCRRKNGNPRRIHPGNCRHAFRGRRL